MGYGAHSRQGRGSQMEFGFNRHVSPSRGTGEAYRQRGRKEKALATAGLGLSHCSKLRCLYLKMGLKVSQGAGSVYCSECLMGADSFSPRSGARRSVPPASPCAERDTEAQTGWALAIVIRWEVVEPALEARMSTPEPNS